MVVIVVKKGILKALSKYNVVHDNIQQTTKNNQLNMKHIVFNGKNIKHPERMPSNKQMPLCCFFFIDHHFEYCVPNFPSFIIILFLVLLLMVLSMVGGVVLLLLR